MIVQIWQIADTENRGFLTSAGFAIVLRLIGYAQAGRSTSAELALKRKLGDYFLTKAINANLLRSSWRPAS